MESIQAVEGRPHRLPQPPAKARRGPLGARAAVQSSMLARATLAAAAVVPSPPPPPAIAATVLALAPSAASARRPRLLATTRSKELPAHRLALVALAVQAGAGPAEAAIIEVELVARDRAGRHHCASAVLRLPIGPILASICAVAPIEIGGGLLGSGHPIILTVRRRHSSADHHPHAEIFVSSVQIAPTKRAASSQGKAFSDWQDQSQHLAFLCHRWLPDLGFSVSGRLAAAALPGIEAPSVPAFLVRASCVLRTPAEPATETELLVRLWPGRPTTKCPVIELRLAVVWPTAGGVVSVAAGSYTGVHRETDGISSEIQFADVRQAGGQAGLELLELTVVNLGTLHTSHFGCQSHRGIRRQRSRQNVQTPKGGGFRSRRLLRGNRHTVWVGAQPSGPSGQQCCGPQNERRLFVDDFETGVIFLGPVGGGRAGERGWRLRRPAPIPAEFRWNPPLKPLPSAVADLPPDALRVLPTAAGQAAVFAVRVRLGCPPGCPPDGETVLPDAVVLELSQAGARCRLVAVQRSAGPRWAEYSTGQHCLGLIGQQPPCVVLRGVWGPRALGLWESVSTPANAQIELQKNGKLFTTVAESVALPPPVLQGNLADLEPSVIVGGPGRPSNQAELQPAATSGLPVAVSDRGAMQEAPLHFRRRYKLTLFFDALTVLDQLVRAPLRPILRAHCTCAQP